MSINEMPNEIAKKICTFNGKQIDPVSIPHFYYINEDNIYIIDNLSWEKRNNKDKLYGIWVSSEVVEIFDFIGLEYLEKNIWKISAGTISYNELVILLDDLGIKYLAKYEDLLKKC